MFRVLKNSTTADAADINDNFYHVFEGSILPMSGNYLRHTDSSCNIGSSTYKWNNAYIDNIYANNIICSGSISSTNIWSLISEFSVNATYTSTSRIEFTSLDGYDNYMIDCVFNISLYATASSIVMVINNDSSTTHHYNGIVLSSTYTTAITSDTESFPIVIAYGSGTQQAYFSKICVNQTSSKIDAMWDTISPAHTVYSMFLGAGYQTATTAISSFAFYPQTNVTNFLTGTTIKVYGR